MQSYLKNQSLFPAHIFIVTTVHVSEKACMPTGFFKRPKLVLGFGAQNEYFVLFLDVQNFFHLLNCLLRC